jgi:hypothetical protein
MQSVEAVRLQLDTWRAHGIGLGPAAEASGVAASTLWSIRQGCTGLVRMDTAHAILEAQPRIAGGQRVSGTRTRRLIRSLETEGFTLGDIAERLGLRTRRLQLHHKQVTVRNARKVARLYQTVMAE